MSGRAGRDQVSDKPAGNSDDAAARTGDGRPALTPAAERALAEAAARRAEIDRKVAGQPKELRGRTGPEPTRYGDWETKGIASDF
jgi:hypothetical protein